MDGELVGMIDRHIDERRLADTALSLISVPSPTCSAGEVADLLADLLAGDGFAVERPEADWPEAPAVVVRLDTGKPGKVLQFDGHLDTVHLPFVDARCEDGQIYGTGASQLDMHTGRYGGSPDGYGVGPAMINLARFYGVPANLWGTSTKSKFLDAQYGYEAMGSTMLGILAGADEIYSLGLLGEAQILSLEKMVLDNHLIGIIEQMLTPVDVSDDFLQADLIKEVGIGGEFLTRRETLKQTRAHYIPRWPPHGTDLLEMIHQETRKLLSTHQPPPLPNGAEQTLQEILAEADHVLLEQETI